MLAPPLAPGRVGDVMHYRLHDQHILPYIMDNDVCGMDTEKTGGYGKVFMVRLHADHHNFRDERLCKQGFAVKQQMHTDARDTFEKEIAILKTFSGEKGHHHIVSLLATYEQFGKLHLLFYRADGDLFAYWSQIAKRPCVTYKNVVWTATQCEGLAEALLKLHRRLTFDETTDLSLKLASKSSPTVFAC